ncbi:hypothetical protein ACH4NX_38390, partial [Streptomyces sp. NPDC017225]|uniref:hypothetical protein n=1 Tax=Streptomyces sp. NPDC017225 TaxID=3364982 RepID=UPI0037B3C60F
MQMPDGRQQRGGLGPLTPRRGHRDRPRHRLPGHTRENPVRSDLQEPAHTLVPQTAHIIGEPHRITNMPHPEL